MNRLLILIGFGLSLVSCDKPDSSSESKQASEKTSAHGKYAIREKPSDYKNELSAQLDSARKRKSLAEREKALAEVAWNAIELDPEIAHQAFAGMSTDSPEKIRLIQHYAMRLAESDPAQAEEWAKGLETEKETAVAIGHIAIQIADDDPRYAAKLLSSLPDQELDAAVVQVIQRWATKSEADAAAWVVLFSPGPAREAGMKVVAEQWLPHDSASAFDWLISIKDPLLRKEAASAMQAVISQQSPEIREAWLKDVSAETREAMQPENK